MNNNKSDGEDHMESEKALLESAARYRRLFEGLAQGVVYQARDGSIIDANPAAESILGRILGLTLDRKQDLTSFDPSLRYIREDGSDFPVDQQPAMAALRTGKPVLGVIMGVHNPTKNERRWISIDSIPEFLSGERQPHQVFTTLTDITERKKAEDELRIMSCAIADAIAGIALADLDGKINYVNNAWLNMHGYESPADVTGTAASQHVQDPSVAIAVKEFIKTKGEWTGELMCRRSDGSVFPSELFANVVKDAAGRPLCLLASFRDITERKKAQEAKDSLLKAVSAASEGIAITDEEDRFVYVNEAHARIYGYISDEIIGKTWRDTIPVDLEGTIERELEMTLHNRAVGIWSGEAPALRKDGSVLPTEVTATSRWDESGNYLGHICIVRDVTERKRAEEVLLIAQRRFETVLDSIDGAVYVADMATYEMLFMNRYGRERWGDGTGRPCWQTLQSGQTGPCSFCTNSQLVLPDGEPAPPVVWEFQNTANGRWYECRDQAIRWLDGRLVRLEIAIEITDRKEKEALIKKNRLMLNDAERIGKFGAWEFDSRTLRVEWSEGVRIIHEVDEAYEQTVENGINFYTSESKPIIAEAVKHAIIRSEPFDLELQITTARGNLRDVRTIGKSDPAAHRVYGFFQDITEKKNAERERERLIRELKDALEQVKLLSGIIPICAYCKKIRDDKGYWEDVATYISKHSEALFSHGMCPDCAKKAYEELGRYKAGKSENPDRDSG